MRGGWAARALAPCVAVFGKLSSCNLCLGMTLRADVTMDEHMRARARTHAGRSLAQLYAQHKGRQLVGVLVVCSVIFTAVRSEIHSSRPRFFEQCDII
jgi:hypothetical protein